MVPEGRPLRVGIQLPEVEREVRWPEYVALARRAEEVGFDSVWVGDHLLYRYPDGTTRGPWDAWTLHAAIAAGLRAYGREGIGHVQLVVDPITEQSIDLLAAVLEALDSHG